MPWLVSLLRHGRTLQIEPYSPTTERMTGTNTKLTTAVDGYFADLGRVRASGGATGERSSYGPLTNLLNTAEVIYWRDHAC